MGYNDRQPRKDASGRDRGLATDSAGRMRDVWQKSQLSAGGDVDLSGGSTNGLNQQVTPGELFDSYFGTAERHAALISGGYVEPTFLRPRTRAEHTDGIEDFWAQDFLASGQSEDIDKYPQLPDDFRPMKTAGHAQDGNSLDADHRAQRMRYEVDGWNFRFSGSVKNCRDYAKTLNGKSFRIGVVATDPSGRSVQGTMLVTSNGDHQWVVQPLGDNSERSQMVAAGVQAALEARRVTSIRNFDGGLQARLRARKSADGIPITRTLKSTWIDSVAYNSASGTMVTRTSSGKIYGHSVPVHVFDAVASDPTPGKVFNQMVKGHSPVQVEQCPSCRRVYDSGRGHQCRTSARPSEQVTVATIMQTRAARRLAESFDRYRQTAIGA